MKARLLKLLEAFDQSDGFITGLLDQDPLPAGNPLERISPSDEKPGDKIGRYQLLELIGEGAWGSVWMARQTADIDRKVALKILKLGLDTKDFLARFEAERQMLALMDHPNIAHVLDAGATDRGRPYLVMELVKGIPLNDYADRNRLTVRERIQLLIRICKAVHHAHQKGIIHRDLKPSNILVTRQDEEAMPKVIDFGIAKSNQSRATDKTLFTSIYSFIGTPVYSSPEQLAFCGLEITARSDIYSLGVLLYELLCGQVPFSFDRKGEDALDAFRNRVRESEPAKPSRRFMELATEERSGIAQKWQSDPRGLESQLKGELDWIALKCLEKDPARRYATVQDLAQDLEAHLENRPVSAAAPSLAYRTRKFITRKRPAYALGLELALVLVVLFAGYLIFRNPQKASVPGSSAASSVSTDLKFIAVLPFDNRSNQEEDRFFTDGIHDDLLTQISHIKDVKTISRASVVEYKDSSKSPAEIGKELGVSTVLQGGVQRAGNQVRINVRFIDVETDTHLWAETYTRELTAQNIFEIQSEIASAIANELRTVFPDEEQKRLAKFPTENLAALEAYFKGITAGFSTRDLDEAVHYLEKAVELDPDFALAHARLAHAYQSQIWYSGYPQEEQVRKAEPHLARAMELDPSLSEAWTVKGLLEKERGSYQAAAKSYEKAIELNPNYDPAYLNYSVLLYWNLQQVDPALEMVDKAIQLNPDENNYYLHKADVLSGSGRIEESRKIWEQLSERNSGDANVQIQVAENLAEGEGRFDQGLKALRRAHFLDPDNPRVVMRICEVYARLEGMEKLLFWLDRALKLFPDTEYTGMFKVMRALMDGDLEVTHREWLQQYASGNLRNTFEHVQFIMQLSEWDLLAKHPERVLDRYRILVPDYFKEEFQIPDVVLTDDFHNMLSLIYIAEAFKMNGEQQKAQAIFSKLLENPSNKAPELFNQFLRFLAGEKTEPLDVMQEIPGEPYQWSFPAIVWHKFQGEPFFLEATQRLKAWQQEMLRNISTMEANGELAPLPEF